MSITKLVAASAIAAALSLQIATVASAHPGMYLVTAKIARVAETQVITVNATGGTFNPSTGAPAVPYNASAEQVRAALESDPAIGFDNVMVTGNAGGPYTVTFQGNLAGTNAAQIVPNATGLTGGTATATTTIDGGGDVAYPTDASGMALQDQYIIANDGYIFGIRETNGVASGGMVNYKYLPTAYRATMTKDQIVSSPLTQTSFQAHATCEGVAALANSANIFAWQGDPFYNYIPWQKTSVGTGGNDANPSTWITVVQQATGVNLAALNTVAEFTAACTGIGGMYAPADTVSNVSSATVADAVTAATAPLQAQVDSLTASNTMLQTQVTAIQTQLDNLTRTDQNRATEVIATIGDINVLLKRVVGADSDRQVRAILLQIEALLKRIAAM